MNVLIYLIETRRDNIRLVASFATDGAGMALDSLIIFHYFFKKRENLFDTLLLIFF